MRIITGAPVFFASRAGMAIECAPGILAAEAAARVLADDHHLGLVHADPACDRGDGLRDALGRAVQIERAVAPVGHGRPGLERLVVRGRGVEGLVEHECRVTESGLDVAVAPLAPRVAERQRAVGRRGKGLRAPLHRGDLAADKCVALQPGVRAAGTQAGHRVDHERQRLEIQPDELDGGRRRGFVDGGNGENRLALVDGFVGEGALGGEPTLGRGHGREVIGRQHGLHAGQRQRGPRVDPAHAAVRHGAQQQLAEEHAVGAEVFRVLGAAGHLGDQVGRRVVAADELGIGHGHSLTRAGRSGRFETGDGVGSPTRRWRKPRRAS